MAQHMIDILGEESTLHRALLPQKAPPNHDHSVGAATMAFTKMGQLDGDKICSIQFQEHKYGDICCLLTTSLPKAPFQSVHAH